MKKSLILVAAISSLLVGSGTLLAHHGTGASYDMHKVAVVKGVITKFVMANPHSQLYFDAKDENGTILHWSAEMRNPRNLEAQGHTKKELLEKLAPGAQVTVTGNPSKA